MTAGFPDFQSYATWRGPALVSVIADAIPGGGKSYGTFAIPHYAGVSVFASCANPTLVVQLTFSPDAAGLTVLQQMQFTILGTCKLTCNVPALAPYVTVQVLNPPAGATSINLFVQPTNIPAQSPQYINSTKPAPLLWAQASVAASGSLTAITSEVYAGPAILFAGTSSGTAFHGVLNYWDATALAFQNIGAWQGSIDGQRVNRLVALPAAQCQMSGSNDDTVARTLTYGLLRAA